VLDVVSSPPKFANGRAPTPTSDRPPDEPTSSRGATRRLAGSTWCRSPRERAAAASVLVPLDAGAGEAATPTNSMLVTLELSASGAGTVLRLTEIGVRERGCDVAVLEESYHEHQRDWDFYLPRIADRRHGHQSQRTPTGHAAGRREAPRRRRPRGTAHARPVGREKRYRVDDARVASVAATWDARPRGIK
jgi:hypothetical protein